MQVERDRNPIQRPKPTRPYPTQAGEARDRNPVPRPQPQRPGFPAGEQVTVAPPEGASQQIPNFGALFK